MVANIFLGSNRVFSSACFNSISANRRRALARLTAIPSSSISDQSASRNDRRQSLSEHTKPIIGGRSSQKYDAHMNYSPLAIGPLRRSYQTDGPISVDNSSMGLAYVGMMTLSRGSVGNGGEVFLMMGHTQLSIEDMDDDDGT